VAYAPVITTVVGLGALLTLLALILLWSERLGLDNAMAGIIAALIIMLPHTTEVTANATNLQWIAAAICVLVLLLPADGSKVFSFYRWPRWPSDHPADTSVYPQMCSRPIAV